MNARADDAALAEGVAAFLDGPSQQVAFPAHALEDPRAAQEYLSMVRKPVNTTYPVRRVTDYPVRRVTELTPPAHPRMRVYEPFEEGPHPVIVYFHGGGWVMGDLEMHDATCRALCRGGFVVVNVDYRLAPEHPFPAASDDAVDAIRWAAEHVSEFSGDPQTLIAAGSSAGANLVVSAALRLRETGPRISRTALVYPVLDSRMDTHSFQQFASGFHLSRPQMEWYWRQYVPDDDERRDPFASPAHAPSIAGMPPALVFTAELDPLRDEGEQYAQRLRAEGIDAEVVRWPGQIHGFMTLLGVLPDAQKALDDLVGRLAAYALPNRAT